MVAENEIVAVIVSTVWKDDVEIVGRKTFDQLLKNEIKFELPKTGDHIDLMPIINVIKASIEVIAAAAQLYFLIRDKLPSKGRNDKNPSQEAEIAVRDKLMSEKIDGNLLTSSQVDTIINLLKTSKPLDIK